MTKINMPTNKQKSRVKKVSVAAKLPKAADPAVAIQRAANNPFGIDNAKQLPLEDAVRFFVPQPEFVRLFVPKNHILLGSRGSGKTTWVRMMAHDHVALAAKQSSPAMNYARDALRQNLIGIYVPASAAFAGDLRNKPWQDEVEAENYFVWRLNLHTCSALTHIIDSCIEQYISADQLRPKVQVEICRKLSAAWTKDSETCTTFEGLRLLLTSIELKHQEEVRRRRTSNTERAPYTDHFDTDLFLPLKHSLNVIRSYLHIPNNAVRMVCLDEVEYLSPLHHRILNTQLRSASGDLVFKIATMPFAHHTLATNLGDPVQEGHDFEYVYVDREPIDSRGASVDGEFLKFARLVFRRRIGARSSKLASLTLKELLGSSILLDEKRIESDAEMDSFMLLLRRHANQPTILRAERLRNTTKFKSEIVRKMHGALLLRDALSNQQGNTKLRIYSGEAVIVRCSDGNVRRLMRIVNSIVQRITFGHDGIPSLPVDDAVQTEVLETLGRETLDRTQSEPPHGDLTASMLTAIGTYMRWSFSASNRNLGTDQVTSVRIEESDGADAQKFIKQAIQLSLMTPSRTVAIKTPDHNCVGDFHLAFLFAPLFHVLPRRNDAVRLGRVLAHSAGRTQNVPQHQGSLLDAP